MVHLFGKYFGRGPTRARTTLNTNVAVIAMAEMLRRAEQNLIRRARPRRCVRSGERFMGACAEAVAVIEQRLRREVVGYMADVDTQANMGVVVFVLRPEAESGVVEVADSDPEAFSSTVRGYR